MEDEQAVIRDLRRSNCTKARIRRTLRQWNEKERKTAAADPPGGSAMSQYPMFEESARD